MKNLDDHFDAILITGPTASGKSALALRLAQAKGGEIVNADSMQVYDTLRVLTARPSLAEMEGIAHHLYGHVPASAVHSTGAWLREASETLTAIRAHGRLPIVIGGTGLYFRALTGGLSDMPDIPAELRAALRARLESEGSEALHRVLGDADPQTAARLAPGDAQRIVRALEVFEASGRPLSSFQAAAGPVVVDPARALKLVALPPRETLYERIDRRFLQMMDEGAVEEVRALQALALPADRPVMRAIGVQQIGEMLAGRLSTAEAATLSATATRQYAKRQMTWFRNQMGEDWQRIDPTDAVALRNALAL
ncbi:tRNA dimethylallyltransferase [Rhizobium sp. RU20A]|nr:tRNA dimethylallyltransferase [Rhizobium sp. RU20A]